MNVFEAVESRRSIRDFLPTPVDAALIRKVLAAAARSASGGNLQPWHLDVIAGEPLQQLKDLMQTRVIEAPSGDEHKDYSIYPPELVAPYRDRRFQVGEDMYALLGVPREDKAGRLRWFARNYQFFGAPLALFWKARGGMPSCAAIACSSARVSAIRCAQRCPRQGCTASST